MHGNEHLGAGRDSDLGLEMPGAYTSTPIVPEVPDLPDGWDSDWDFPPGVEGEGGDPPAGPYPPGFDPEDCDDDDGCQSIFDTGSLAECDNASSATEIYIGSWDATACSEDVTSYCTADQRVAATDAGSAVVVMLSDWSTLWSDYCESAADLETLECELMELQCRGNASGIASKESEITAQETICDAKLAAANAKSDEMDTQAALSRTLANVAAPKDCQYFFSAAPAVHGLEPYTNTACADLGPTCAGRDPLRCAPTWRVQQKSHTYWLAGGESHGEWITEMSGGYTVSGQAYVTYIRACAGIVYYACYSGNCVTLPCATYQAHEVRLFKYFPAAGGEVSC